MALVRPNRCNTRAALRAAWITAALWAGAAGASPIQVDLTGAVTALGGSEAAGNGVFSVGDEVLYSLVFEETPLSASPAARSTSAVVSYSASVGSYDLAGSSGDIFTRNDGTAGSIFGGAPFDQVSVSHNRLDVNELSGLPARSDFDSDDGPVAGQAIRSLRVTAQTDDTSFLASNDIDRSIFDAMAGSAALFDNLEFLLSFSNETFGTLPLTVRGDFDTITVTDLGVGSGDPADPELPVNVQPGPVFEFDVGVEAGTLVFIDPDIAIGYDYAIGAGDPGFRSVLLPEAGDDLFDLFLFDPAGNPFDTGIDLLAGVEFDFLAELAGFGVGAAGLDRFGIRGIETSAMLDAQDPTAFVTGLTFVEDGRFTGTMTPVVASALPETDTLVLLASGLLGVARRRKPRVALPPGQPCLRRPSRAAG